MERSRVSMSSREMPGNSEIISGVWASEHQRASVIG